jgi:hypothetical protein
MNWGLFWFMIAATVGLVFLGFVLGRLYEHLHGFNRKLLDRR